MGGAAAAAAAAGSVKVNVDVAEIMKATTDLLKAMKGQKGTQATKPFSMALPKGVAKKDLGKPSYAKGGATKSVTWQSINDDILEYFGMQEKSGYDVKFTASVEYTVVTYSNLVEPIIQDMIVTGDVSYNTVAAYVMSSMMKYEISVRTNPNDTMPRGVVIVPFSLNTGLDSEQGQFKFDIQGTSCSVSGGW